MVAITEDIEEVCAEMEEELHSDDSSGWATESDEDSDEEEYDVESMTERHDCYVGNNTTERKSIIEKVVFLLESNKIPQKSYDSEIKLIRKDLDNVSYGYNELNQRAELSTEELYRVRAQLEERKSRIKKLEKDIEAKEAAKNLLTKQNDLTIKEKELLSHDNARLNSEIQKLYQTVDTCKTKVVHEQNYSFPWLNRTAGLQEGTDPNTFQTAKVMHPSSDNITQRFLDKDKTINHDFDNVSMSTVDQSDAPNFNVYQNENVFFPTPLPQPPPLSSFVPGPATDPCSVNIRPTPKIH